MATNDRDLNDRQDSAEDLLDEIPDLERHHVPHAERRERAALRKVKKKPSNLRQAGAQVAQGQPQMQSQESTTTGTTGADGRASR